MKKALAFLLCFLLCLPASCAVQAEKDQPELNVEASLHMARFSFVLEDERYAFVEFATANDTGKMVLYAEDGHFSGECPLYGTDTQDTLRVNVSSLKGTTLLRAKVDTVAAEEKQSDPALDTTVKASSDAENVVLSVDEEGVHYAFDVPGRDSVLLRCRTPQESHTLRLYADQDYHYEGTVPMPLSYPDDRVTVTVLAVKSSIELYKNQDLLMPYAVTPAVEKAETGRLSGVKVCIDPGHQRATEVETVLLGPGFKKQVTTTVGMAKGKVTQRRESIVVLEVAQLLRDALLREGAEVIMTRESQDVFVGMLERADIPNDAGVDFVLRLHCNSRDDAKVKGIQIYCPYQSEYALAVAPEDTYRQMGFTLLDAMKAATGTTKGTCTLNNNYVGNNWAKMPSFLVEMGYLSNREEDLKMATSVYQQQLADGMVEGIVELAQMRGLIE